MKENLRAKSYRDGSALSMQTEQGEGISGYYKPDGEEVYFYNGEAILANTLAPRGWRIPTTEDWETLRDYVNNDASLIRAGDWEAPDIEDPVLPCSNLTGFDGYPVGMWHRGEYWNSTKMSSGIRPVVSVPSVMPCRNTLSKPPMTAPSGLPLPDRPVPNTKL